MPASSTNTRESDDSQAYDITEHLSDQEIENAVGITAERELRRQDDRPPSAQQILARVAELQPHAPDWSIDEVATWLRALNAELDDVPGDTATLVREKAVSILKDVDDVQSPAKVADRFLDTADRSDTTRQDDDLQGSKLKLEDPAPINNKVGGPNVLNSLRKTYNRFLVLPEGGDVALALWTIHAHAHDAARVSPILAVTSPRENCGKTTVLSVVSALVPRFFPASNLTPATVFRTIDAFKPTLLADEADTWLEEDSVLRGVLNSGHAKRGAFVPRTVGDDYEPRLFSTWAAKGIALIGSLPDTLDSRSVEIRMKRKKPDETVADWHEGRVDDLKLLKRRAWTWAQNNLREIEQADPDIPDTFNNRTRDNWREMAAIAETAGGKWPELVKDAAKSLESGDTGGGERDDEIKLLNDVAEIFEAEGQDEQDGRLPTQTILRKLGHLDERPWPTFNYGERITARQLADLLRPYNVRSRTLRFDSGDRRKGYRWKDLKDPFSRYGVSNGRDSRDSRDNPGADGGPDDFDCRDTDPDVTADETADDPGDVGNVTGVTVNRPNTGGSDEGDGGPGGLASHLGGNEGV